MLPASLAACVPVFIATPTSACASAGASLVPSPVIATSLPSACSRLMSAILSSGVAWARKSSTPASEAIAAAVSGLSPVIITVLMPMARRCANRSRMPPLTMSFRWMTPSTWRPSATTSGVPPARAMRCDVPASAPGPCRPSPAPTSRSRRPRPCGSRGRRRPPAPAPAAVTAAGRGTRRSTPDMRVWAVNGTNVACCGASSRPRSPYFSLASTTIERPSGVSSGSDASCAASASGALADARQRNELGGLAVAERDRAGLVEEQRVHVAGRLDRAARHRQHVVLHQAVHAGDADGREQAADRRRDEAHEQRHQHEQRLRRARVDRRTAAA